MSKRNCCSTVNNCVWGEIDVDKLPIGGYVANGRYGYGFGADGRWRLVGENGSYNVKFPSYVDKHIEGRMFLKTEVGLSSDDDDLTTVLAAIPLGDLPPAIWEFDAASRLTKRVFSVGMVSVNTVIWVIVPEGIKVRNRMQYNSQTREFKDGEYSR